MLLGSWLKQACWHSPERFDYNMHLTMSSANPLEGSTSSAAARQPWSPPSDNTTHSDIQHFRSAGRVLKPRDRAGYPHLQPWSYTPLPAHTTEPVSSLPRSLFGRAEDPTLTLPLAHLHISFNKPFFVSISLFLLCWKNNNNKKDKKTEEKREGICWFPQLAEHNATPVSSIGVALTWLNSSSRVSLVMSLIPNATLRSQRQQK